MSGIEKTSLCTSVRVNVVLLLMLVLLCCCAGYYTDFCFIFDLLFSNLFRRRLYLMNNHVYSANERVDQFITKVV